MGFLKERWSYKANKHTHIHDKIGEYIVITHDIECSGEVVFRVPSEELAMRIVIEHNACMGLSNELLEKEILDKIVIFYTWNANNPNAINTDELKKDIDRFCVKSAPPISYKP